MFQGWDTGMIGMRSGGKRFLIIPSHLAYGQKAVGNRVPPDSTLAFEVDLLRVSDFRQYQKSRPYTLLIQVLNLYCSGRLVCG